MDVGLATRGRPHATTRGLLVRQLAVASASAATLALLLLAATLLVRRLAGALDRPLTTTSLLLATLLLATTCQLLHVVWGTLATHRRHRLALALPVSGAFLALAIALTIPGSPQVPLGALWAVLVAAEGWAYLVAWRGGARGSRLATPRSLMPRARPHMPALADDASSGEMPPGATQRLLRSGNPQAGETICGTLRESFAPAQRTASVHIAFCPPLAGMPELSIEQVDGPEAAVKIGELQPYGARLDLRLRRSCPEATEVLLELSVVAAGLGE